MTLARSQITPIECSNAPIECFQCALHAKVLKITHSGGIAMCLSSECGFAVRRPWMWAFITVLLEGPKQPVGQPAGECRDDKTMDYPLGAWKLARQRPISLHQSLRSRSTVDWGGLIGAGSGAAIGAAAAGGHGAALGAAVGGLWGRWQALSRRHHRLLITAPTITAVTATTIIGTTRGTTGEDITVLSADRPWGVPRQLPRQTRPRGTEWRASFLATAALTDAEVGIRRRSL